MPRNRRTKKTKTKDTLEFTVYIYESEYRQIQAWVDKHQNLETGGDLFGLWTDDHTAVVQLVLGPGKHCRRTSTSFYQDVKYLERLGNFLTNEEGLCHIGEWHSHHRLGLKEPSGGDENTVWTNMDRYGIYRFLLCIATIDGSWLDKESTPDDVSVRGFLFKVTDENDRLLSGCKFTLLPEKSPFRYKYIDKIKEGAESVNKEQETQRAYAPVHKYKNKGQKHAYQALEVEEPEYEEPEDKKRRHEQSYFRRCFNLIFYVCFPYMWLCCKRLCNALGRCFCRCMCFWNDKEMQDTNATEPANSCWKIYFRDLIHCGCCPICWFSSQSH